MNGSLSSQPSAAAVQQLYNCVVFIVLCRKGVTHTNKRLSAYGPYVGRVSVCSKTPSLIPIQSFREV